MPNDDLRLLYLRHTLLNPTVKPDPHAKAREAASAPVSGHFAYTHGQVYCRGGRIFCSPNSQRQVDAPPPVEDNLFLKFNPTKDHPLKPHQPLWWSEETAYLAFVSIVPTFVGLQAKHSLPPFSDPMEINKYHVVKAGRRGFGLEAWRKLAWYALEKNMLAMVDSMKFKYSLPPTRHVVENTLSVKSFYQNKYTFLANANRAIKWFSLVTAQMTWAIAMATTLDDEIGTTLEDEPPLGFIKRPSWLDWLSTCPVRYWDETMLQSVRKNMGAFGRRKPKVGVFINILDPPKHQYAVDWLLKFDIPVYYIWDEETFIHGLTNPDVARFHPPIGMLQEAFIITRDVCKLRSIPFPDSINSLIERSQIHLPDVTVFSRREPVDYGDLPPSSTDDLREGSTSRTASPMHHIEQQPADPPILYSGEPTDIDDPDKYLYLWKEFSRSRKVETESAIRRQSDKEAHARKQREGNPPTVNTRVYVWEEGHDGVYTRVQVRKNDNDDTLASFKPRHKIYNALFNEWDCAEDFIVNDEAACQEYSSDEDEDDDFYGGYLENSATDIAVALPQPSSTFASDQDAQNVALSDMLTLFREFFGYIQPLEDVPDRGPLPDNHAMHVRHFVGMTQEEVDAVPRQAIHGLHDFVTHVLRHDSNSGLPTAPAENWDLVFGNREYLGSHPLLHGLRYAVFTDGPTYIMFDFGERRTEEWNLTLCSSVSALFVCRLGSALTEKAICSELMRRGIPFFTLLPCQKRQHTSPPSLIQSDVLPPGYNFTREDYEVYIDYRTDLLNNSRICRAALMRGGIIWRLSLSHAKATEESIHLGPTKYVRQQGMSVDFNDGSFQDDCISDEELNIICGTYECQTGKILVIK